MSVKPPKFKPGDKVRRIAGSYLPKLRNGGMSRFDACGDDGGLITVKEYRDANPYTFGTAHYDGSTHRLFQVVGYGIFNFSEENFELVSDDWAKQPPSDLGAAIASEIGFPKTLRKL